MSPFHQKEVDSFLQTKTFLHWRCLKLWCRNLLMECIQLRCNLFLLKHLFPPGFLFPCFHGGLFIFGVKDGMQWQKGSSPALMTYPGPANPSCGGAPEHTFPLLRGLSVAGWRPHPGGSVPLRMSAFSLVGSEVECCRGWGPAASLPDVLCRKLYLISDFYSLTRTAHWCKTYCCSGEKWWFSQHW